MSFQNSIVQFQFSDFHEFDHYEKLKLKLRNLTSNKRVFIAHANGFVSQYEMNQNPITLKFQNVFTRKNSPPSMKTANGLALNKESNELLVSYCDWEICSWSLITGKCTRNVIPVDTEPLCMAWYFEENKRHLVVKNFTFGSVIKTEIWNWETKQPSKGVFIGNVTVAQKDQELVKCGGGTMYWYLKNFKLFGGYYCKYERFSRKPRKITDRKPGFFEYDSGELSDEFKKSNELELLLKKKAITNEWIPGKLVYSSDLCLFVTCEQKCIEFCKLDIEKMKLELDFIIENPFDVCCTILEFLDSNTEKQVLVGDKAGNLFIVDLIFKQIVWKSNALVKSEITCILVE